jgi:hypothetical protein
MKFGSMKRKVRKMPLPDAAVDAALHAEDGILPSSGFADGVMAAVQREAAAPAPIPFPWKRALPGVIVAALCLVVVLITAVRSMVDSPTGALAHPGTLVARASAWQLDLASLLREAANPTVLWVAFSLALPLVCLLVVRRMIVSR